MKVRVETGKIGGTVATAIALLTFYFAVVYKHRELYIQFTELPVSMVPDIKSGEDKDIIKIRVPFINDGDRSETVIAARLVLVNDLTFRKELVGNGSQEGPFPIPAREAKVVTFSIPKNIFLTDVEPGSNIFPVRSVGLEAEWLSPDGAVVHTAFYPYTVGYENDENGATASIQVKSEFLVGRGQRLKEQLIYQDDWVGYHILSRIRQLL
ncbi:hypothetical protein ACTJJ7_11325 [Phyllobacterium sp. 22229]|uniref:Uncharacterized protein n=1 Tax=Agrobacterium radiobacter TaxID=362 RepID=A0ABD5LPR6_AGRRD